MIAWLKPTDPPEAFPPVTSALTDPDGLLCVGGDLSTQRLLAAYRRGIFPWYSEGQPILWWSPDPRMVLFPGEFKVARSLGKAVRNRGFRVTFDTCFDTVTAQAFYFAQTHGDVAHEVFHKDRAVIGALGDVFFVRAFEQAVEFATGGAFHQRNEGVGP